MNLPQLRSAPRIVARFQRGVATLVVTLIILVILTLIILASSNVALFEQKTAVNENRQRLAQQAAEYAISLAGEYFKANISKVSTNVTGGFFDTASTPTNLRWQLCPSAPSDPAHPCYAEPNANRRVKMYYYTGDGSALNASDSSTNALLDVPFTDVVTNSGVTVASGVRTITMGGSASFPAVIKVHALLCLVSPSATYKCETFETRTDSTRIAITMVGQSTMANENASAIVKETWASYTDSLTVSAIPLVASGSVQGLGNAMIVTASNGGGIGLPVSIWSPQDVDVDSSGAGVGSVSTCHLGDYLGAVPESQLQTTCASNSDPCKCTVAATSNNFLSGHTNAVKREDIDILDVDHWPGDPATPTTQPLPDISFYPGRHCTSAGTCTRLDDSTVDTDDNLFEWIFQRDVTSGNGAGYPATAAMDALELAALDDLGATHVADCNGLSSASEGLIYVEGSCNLPNAAVGSPDAPVIIVVNDNASVNGNTVIYGMLFIRDTSTAACTGGGFSGTPAACLTGTGGKFFGSVVVDGDVKLAGSPQIVYVDTSTGSSKDPLKATTRFARVPGTWLDDRKAF